MLKAGLHQTPRIQTSGTRAILLCRLTVGWWSDKGQRSPQRTRLASSAEDPMMNEDPTRDEDPTREGPSRSPTRIEVTSALRLLEWVVEFAENHGSQSLDQSDLDELWIAVDTTLGIIRMGQVGYRRMTDLFNRLDQVRGTGGTLDFDTAARYVGPVIARLSSELENWPPWQV